MLTKKVKDGVDEYSAKALLEAVRAGKVDKVGTWLGRGGDPNATDEKGESILFIAASKGFDGIVQKILTAGGDINATDKLLVAANADLSKFDSLGATPLHIATEYGHQDIVDVLIRAEANVNQINKDGRTPIFMAAWHGHKGLVERFIKSEADINKCDDNGFSPIFMAVLNNHCPIVELLIEADADIYKPNNAGKTPLMIAMERSHIEIATMLLEAGTRDGRSPIYMAALNGHKTIVELLVLVHADLDQTNNEGNTPMHAAASSGHRNIVDMLIKAEASFSISNADRKRLVDAAVDGDLPQVTLLLKKATDPNVMSKDGESVLYIAATNGHQGIVQKLLAAGADVNLVNKHGRSPIISAAEIGHRPIVVMIIRSKADIDHCANNGDSAMYMAAANGHDAVVGMLITCGASISSCSPDAVSPLYAAACNGHTAVVNLLLAMGAEPNVLDKNECSPIYIAASKGYAAIVDLLIQAGGDFTLCNKIGYSPLFIARKRGFREVVKILYDAETKMMKVREEDIIITDIILGRGGQGVVYKGRWKNQDVAVKTVLNNEGLESLQSEITTMSLCNSPYIIKMITVLKSKLDEPKLVLEYMDGGDLRSYLDKKRLHQPTDVEYSKLELAYAITNGIVDLHAQKILHRDLKASNVLLSTNNYIKLADFGIARAFDQVSLTMGIGTSYWIAPEVFDGDGHYGYPADIYSLGVILTELETLQTPYANLNMKFMTILDQVRSGTLRPELTPECDEWYSDLVKACLEHDPAKRPTAKQVQSILEEQMHLVYSNA
ncbi:hypothetical protein THRCLA_04112 [Thraustotheca clavata]|uniref:Protein kinase domain-containing protein n=1 Tax=Thraustotheca clavata TaxID=74557 RepID=A0A1V9ZZW2_9STRA|nr:hypothetical protein THRCLA_04112 [Thraustotheca clavata]